MFAQCTGLLGTILAISNPEPKTSLYIASNCLNECGDDLVPTEGWGDRSQNCLHDVRIIGNT
jgi:hypothetical protein